MKVLMLSGDPRVLNPETAVGKRIAEYRNVLGELEILLCYGSLPRFIAAFFKGLTLLHRKKFDVITAQSPEHWILAWLFSSFFGTPWQMQIHTDFLSPYFWQESLKNKIRVLLGKFLVKRADKIRVVSERIKQSLLTLYPKLYTLNQIDILPIFVDVEKIRAAPIKTDLHKKYPEYDFIILMASRLTREKNIGLAIEAMASILGRFNLHSEGEPLKIKPLLLIVGDGPEKEKLQLLITNYQLQNNVIIEPWREDLASYYKTADLFLLTSNYEGYGMSVVEALGAGLPVLMTDVGVAGELVKNGENGFVIPVGDKNALVRALEDLYKNSLPKKTIEPEVKTEQEYLKLYSEALRKCMPASDKAKLVYILPFYDERTDTHLLYNYKLIETLHGQLDIFVVIEKAKGEIKLKAPFAKLKFKLAPLRFLELFWLLGKKRREGYRNIYVHYSYYGALTGYFAGARVFYWNRGMPWLFRRNFVKEMIFRFILRHTILVTSPESLAEEYKKRYRVRNYRILGDWIDAERFKPREGDKPENPKIILFVHHLSERKGADLIAKIADGFENSDMEFWVIGGGPYLERLKSQSKENKQLKIFGKISNAEVPEYFRKAFIFIMPSREEGSPHVLLEAMASGIPLVASDVGGVRALVPLGFQEVSLCPSGDVQCFKNKIKELMNNKRLYNEFRKAALEFAKKLNKEPVVAKFVSLISEHT